MKLVIDTNILISALIKEATTREILLLPYLNFLLPEFAFEEITRHKDKICRFSGLTEYEVDLLLNMLLERIDIISAQKIKPYLKEARTIIGEIDETDIPFVAAALATNNDGIWSNDKDFDKIKRIKVWKTKEIIKYLKKL
jgi:predicted nucleic acid-binding protein